MNKCIGVSQNPGAGMVRVSERTGCRDLKAVFVLPGLFLSLSHSFCSRTLAVSVLSSTAPMGTCYTPMSATAQLIAAQTRPVGYSLKSTRCPMRQEMFFVTGKGGGGCHEFPWMSLENQIPSFHSFILRSRHSPHLRGTSRFPVWCGREGADPDLRQCCCV